jgi:hypothetical protein
MENADSKRRGGEQCREDEVFGKDDLWRKRQECENNSSRNKADAVRKAKSPGQHRDDSGNQKQQSSGLELEFHVFLRSPSVGRSAALEERPEFLALRAAQWIGTPERPLCLLHAMRHVAQRYVFTIGKESTISPSNPY